MIKRLLLTREKLCETSVDSFGTSTLRLSDYSVVHISGLVGWSGKCGDRSPQSRRRRVRLS